jgi:hypothetical protein
LASRADQVSRTDGQIRHPTDNSSFQGFASRRSPVQGTEKSDRGA